MECRELRASRFASTGGIFAPLRQQHRPAGSGCTKRHAVSANVSAAWCLVRIPVIKEVRLRPP
jgi:hypothetical protein